MIINLLIHAIGYAPEKLKYPIDRYVNETHRLYRTLDQQLAKNGTGFVVGDRVSVVDIAIWPWIAAHSMLKFPLPPSLPLFSLLNDIFSLLTHRYHQTTLESLLLKNTPR